MPELLWAPWRFDYVSQATEGGSEGLFLRLPAVQDDRESHILHRGRLCFAVLNAFPYTSGHTLVVPFRKAARIAELDGEELDEIGRTVADATRWLDAALQPHGYNVGVNEGSAAGAGVPDHVHWHIVPRWRGDTNFMTTVGDVRVIPASLDDAFDRIVAAREGRL